MSMRVCTRDSKIPGNAVCERLQTAIVGLIHAGAAALPELIAKAIPELSESGSNPGSRIEALAMLCASPEPTCRDYL